MNQPLLDVKNLSVAFEMGRGALTVSSDVSFTLEKGKVLGLIGESGSGKTVTSMAILGLLSDQARVTADHVKYRGTDIHKLPAHEFDKLRGADLAMIFQDPVGSFNPVKTIGWHFLNVGKRHRREAGSSKALNALAREALAKVDIADPANALRKYPHQLSGGMLQRCLIALVLFCKPSLIVADEPTTNLDNLVERQIISLFDKLRHEIDASFIFITHDMTIAEQVSDSMIVMYAGQIVEQGDTQQVLQQPRHPYTQGLVRTARELEGDVEMLTEIAGDIGTGIWPADKCRFAPRCPLYESACDHPIALREIEGHGKVRCIKADLKDTAA